MENFFKVANEDSSPNRNSLWTNHRNVVKGFFEEIYLKKGHLGRIGIFGAGNCDDLDIEYISSICEEIILFDIDLSSMTRAYENLSIEIRNKITLVKVDLTSLDNGDFYTEYVDLLKSNQKPKKIKNFLVKTANELRVTNEDLKKYFNTCDIVASSAVYSQLFYNWALIELDQHGQYSNKEFRDITENGLVYLRNSIVKFYNDELVSLAKNNAGVIVWADLFEVSPEDYNILKTGDLTSAQPLIFKKGFQASVNGIKGLHSKFAEFVVMRDWIWEFEASKTYYCRGVCGFLGKN